VAQITTKTTTVTRRIGGETTVVTTTTTSIRALPTTGHAAGEDGGDLAISEEGFSNEDVESENSSTAASDSWAPGASLGCAGLGVWAHDAAHETATWSEEVYRLLEHPPAAGDPSWSTMLARLHPEDAAQLTSEVHARNGGTGFGLDVRVATPQPEARWVYVFVRVDRDPKGRLTRLSGFVTDASARKRSESQLRRLAEIGPRSDNLVVLTGVDGRIEWVNAAFMQRTEYSLDEVVGRRPAELLQGPASDATVIAAMSAALRARTPFRGELVNYSKSGKQYWVALTIQPLLGEKGEHTGFMAIQTDTTTRKLADQARELDREIADTLLQATSLDAAAPRLLRSITTLLQVASAQLWRVAPGEEHLLYVAGYGAGVQAMSFVETSRELRFRAGTVFGEVGVGAPGLAWGTRRSQVVREFWGTSRRSAAARAAGIVTVISVPILVQEGVLGVLELGGAALYPGHEELPEKLEQLCRRLAEFELRSLERRRFETMFERSPDGVLLVSPNGTVIQANAEALRLFGRGAGGRLGESLEGAAAMVQEVLDADTAPGPPAPRRMRGVRADGTELHLEVSLAPIGALPTGSNALRQQEQQVLVTVRDVTEQVQIATELEQERETRRNLEVQHHTIERLVRFLPVPLILVSKDGRIEVVNTATTALLGRTAETLLGAPITLLLPRWNDLATSDITNGTREVMLLSPEGHLIPADLRASVFDDGVSQSVLLALIDQREHKRMEGAILHALDAAEASTLAKSRFLANMSHVIRTPLSVILGLSRIALERPPGESTGPYFEKVNAEASNLLRIVSDIFDLSKAEAGDLQLEQVSFPLEETVAAVIERFGITAHERGLALLFEEDGSLPARVLGDPLRFVQILDNVVGNAIKFTESGEVHVTLRARREDGVARVLCVVRDTGIGMRPSTVQDAFRPFTQADASSTRKFGGTGLGLKICKELCDRMGGRIDVESALGRGTTLRVELPFPIDAEGTPPAPDAQLVGLPVLVVSGQPTATRITCALLERLGLRTHAAMPVTPALAALRSARRAGSPVELLVYDAGSSDSDAGAFLARIPVEDRPRAALVVVPVTDALEPGAAGDVAFPVIRLRGPLRPGTLHTSLIEALAGASVTVETGAVGGGTLAGARVLVVDDHPVNVEILRSILEDEGVVVATAANGIEAVARVATAPLGPDGRPFHLVLMDIQMPQMDGLTAARTIRALVDPARASVPIVSLTANSMANDAAKSHDAGMNGHLTKPVDFDALRRTVLHWCAPAGRVDTLSN